MLDGPERLVRTPPRLLPGRQGGPPRRRDALTGSEPPRSKAVAQPTDQPRERLEKVKSGGEGATFRKIALPSVRVREGGGGRAQPCLDAAERERRSQKRDRGDEWGPEQAEEREQAESADQEVPLRHQRQTRKRRRRLPVERLERCQPPCPLVDPVSARAQRLREPPAIQATLPRQMTARVVFLRPLLLEEGLGLAVAHLLLPVGAHGIS